MAQIVIKDLEVFYHVGVPDAERSVAQRLLITVEMEKDFAGAARHDDLRETVDYFAVCQRLLGLGKGRSWRLIETLAVEIATLIQAEFATEQVRVEIKKFIIPEAGHVAVRYWTGGFSA